MCHLKYQTALLSNTPVAYFKATLQYLVCKGNLLEYNTTRIKVIVTKDEDRCNLQDYILGIMILHWIKRD